MKEEIRGKIVEIERDTTDSIKWLVLEVNGEEKRFCADSRMLLRAITDGGFSRGDEIVAQVESGLVFEIDFDR